MNIEPIEDNRFNIFYTTETECYKLAVINAAPNGFSYLRELYEVDGFNRADYEILLEYAESAEELQDHQEGGGSYDLAGNVDRFFSSDAYSLKTGNPYKPPVKTET